MNISSITIMMFVLIFFEPAVWDLNQHRASFCSFIKYDLIQSALFKDLNSVNKNFIKLSDEELTLIVLYGSTQFRASS